MPVNSFGHLWTRETALRERLGFATAPEQEYPSAIQTAALTSSSELWLVRLANGSHLLIQHIMGSLQWWPK